MEVKLKWDTMIKWDEMMKMINDADEKKNYIDEDMPAQHCSLTIT